MILIGLALFIVWLLVQVFGVVLAHAILATSLVYIILGFIVGERPWERKL